MTSPRRHHTHPPNFPFTAEDSLPFTQIQPPDTKYTLWMQFNHTKVECLRDEWQRNYRAYKISCMMCVSRFWNLTKSWSSILVQGTPTKLSTPYLSAPSCTPLPKNFYKPHFWCPSYHFVHLSSLSASPGKFLHIFKFSDSCVYIIQSMQFLWFAICSFLSALLVHCSSSYTVYLPMWTIKQHHNGPK